MDSQNILVTTLGSWRIIPELLGFTNPNQLDLYQKHPKKQVLGEARSKHKIEPVNQIWIISTDSNIIRTNSINPLNEWNQKLSQPFQLRYFLLKGVNDIIDQSSAKGMADLIYRVVLRASEQKGKGQLLLSLAGGRKTMSADMQQAGQVFGCGAMIHVVENGNKNKQPSDFQFTTPLPSEFADIYMPLVVSTKAVKMAILDVEPRIKAVDFPLVHEGGSDYYKPGYALINKIEDRQRKARSILVNYAQTLTGGSQRTNFRALYALEPGIIRKLQTLRIGVNSEKQNVDFTLLRKLPKAELHCHFGGILNPLEMIETALANMNEINALRRQNTGYDKWLISISKMVESEDVSGLKQIVPNVIKLRTEQFTGISEPYTIAGFLSQFNGFSDVLEKFIYGEYSSGQFQNIGIEQYEMLGDLQGSGLLQSEASLRAACRILIRQCEKENVRYMEVRHSPIKYTRGGLDARKVVTIIEEELAKAKQTMFRAVFIGSRHGEVSEIKKHIKLALELLENDKKFSDWIVGFDLAGAESAKKPATLRDTFLPLMEKCINITIHAGEDQPVQNIWEAVYHLNADRIGHGLTLNENEKLKKRFLDRKIAIEMCPSSNDQIVGYSEKEYPLKCYLDEGLRVTVNSDNPGISRTNYSSEYLKAAQLSDGGLSFWEILQLLRNSFQASFLPFAERQRLILNAEKDIISVINSMIQDN